MKCVKLSVAVLGLIGGMLLVPQARAQSEIDPDHFDGTDPWAVKSVTSASQRLTLKARVVILSRGDDNKTASEETQTITVNAHGAMVVSRLKLLVGQLVTLRNSRTGEEASCRVVYLSQHQTDHREVGIEFVEPRPQFWRIPYPPSGRTTRSPDVNPQPR